MFLGDLKPSGQFVMEDLHDVGGTPALIKMLLERGALNILTGITDELEHQAPRFRSQLATLPLLPPAVHPGAPGPRCAQRGGQPHGGSAAKQPDVFA